MRLRIKVAGVLASGLAVVMGYGPLSAHAATELGAVVVEGATGTLTPVPLLGTPANPVYSFGEDNPGNPNPGCLAVVTVQPSPGVSTNCTIGSTGTYTNIVCGTGVATATAGNTAITDGKNAYSNIAYGIQFFAGVGLLQGSATVNGDASTLVGVVDIAPTASGLPDTSKCVTQFQVAGVVVATNL